MAKKLLGNLKVESISGGFTLDQLTMKDKRWTAKMSIGRILPKSYHDYSAVMLFNEEPYEAQIKRLEEKITDVKKVNKLFKDDQKKEIRDYMDDIKDVQRDMAEVKRQCATIEFTAVVEKLQYSGADTKLEMRIPDNIIEPINKVKNLLNFYIIELKPIL